MATFPFKTIAFDLDGTIADTAPDLASALNAALASLGRDEVPLARVRTMIGHGTHALLRNGLTATGDCTDALIHTAYPLLLDHYKAHICDETRPYPGVEAAWDQLSAKGIALAVCTNKPSDLTLQLIDALGWRHRFAAIVAGDTLPVAKPDPAPLQLAIERAGGGPAAFVGDSIVDIQTARAAGVPAIAASFGFADRPVHELGADAIIDSYADLDAALAGLS